MGCPGIGIDSSCPTAFYNQKSRSPAEGTRVFTYHAGENLLQPVSRANGFDLSAIQAVFKFEERLANWIREGDQSRIYKGDVSYSPSLSKNNRLEPPQKSDPDYPP